MAEIFKGTSGPRDAKVAIVGEAWGREEEAQALPFVGQSGNLLRSMLQEASIIPAECFFTNVVSARPPGNNFWEWFVPAKDAKTDPSVETIRGLHPTAIVKDGLTVLEAQLRAVNPTVIIAAGNYALWALSSVTKYATRQDSKGRRVPTGIESWRGSQIYVETIAGLEKTYLLPVIHPASVMREWYKRAITVHDLRRTRAALNNDWRPVGNSIATFIAPPSFEEACKYLDSWIIRAREGPYPFRLQVDIETYKMSMISCIGFAPSEVFAMSIPFIRPTSLGLESYWNEHQEAIIVDKIRTLLNSTGVDIEGQNFLYDIQYLQEFLGCHPHISFDTLLAQHVLFPGTPKDLGYLSSLYCRYHTYWKEDHKEWDLKLDLPRLLEYNCRDCVVQYEVASAQRPLIEKCGLTDQWKEQLDINQMCLKMMNRGVKIDSRARATFALELQAAMDDLHNWIMSIVPQKDVNPNAKTWWYRSDKQIRELFVEDLGFALPRHRKTGQPTFGKEAFPVLKEKHPEFTKLFEGIENFRKLRTFHQNFIQAPLEPDGRIRCMFGRTETFRLTSSENAFGRGTNLQNIPKGSED